MKSRTIWITLLVIVLLIGGAFVFGAAVAFFAHSMSGKSKPIFASGRNIGYVKIEETIIRSKDIVEQLEDFRVDDSVKAIIMRIDSPGGSVAASQEIYHAAKKAAEDKPVIASMGTVAASGGYYVALGATKILANPGTITGSIGVRLDHLMIKDLLEWAKVKHETLKSGKFKDIGSMDRPMTPEERELLQKIMDDIHAQFKEAVAMERKLDPKVVDGLADGRIFTGREAFEMKLVDQLGGLVAAIDLAKELGKIKGEPELIEKRKFRYEWIGELVESAVSKIAEHISVRKKVRLPLYGL